MTVHRPAELLRHLMQVLQKDHSVDVAARGAQLVRRLQGPLHITVIGRPGVGKSRLAELLMQQKDLPALTVTESRFNGDMAQLHAATSGADLVLVCAQEVSASELTLWSGLPDVVKDHSFLVLTKADILVAQGQFQSALGNLGLIATEEFHSLFPLATLQAIDSVGPGCAAAFRASGAATFMAALAHQLALDQEAARDSAFLFLDRSGKSAEAPMSVSKKAAEKPPDPVPFDYLQRRAAALRDMGQLALPEKIRAILRHCSETTEGLVNLLDQPDLKSAKNADLVKEVLAVADTMTLLTLEGSASAAIDALALLLQLRRDLSQPPEH